MPKTLVDLEGLEPLDGDFEDISALEQDLDSELDSIFSEFDGNDEDAQFTILVYRPKTEKGKLSYMFRCTPLELPILDRLRDDYDGGSFQVRITKGGKLFRRLSVLVEPPPKSKVSQIEKTDVTVSMMSAMNQGFQRLGEIIIQQKENLPTVNSTKETLENMLMMKEILGTQAPPPPLDPIRLLKDVMGIQKSLNTGQSDKETNMNDVFLGLAEHVLPKLAEAGLNENVSETLDVSEKSNIQDKPTVNTVKVSPMKMHLVFLCMQAKKNRSPDIYAQMVLDNTDDDKLEELIIFMDSDTAFDDMCKIHKDVKNYPEWFEKLKQAILSEVEDVEENVDDKPLTVNDLETKTEDNVPSQSSEPIVNENNRDTGTNS